MIVDAPPWAMLLLDMGSGALVAVGVFTFFTWWDHRRMTKKDPPGE